VSELIELLSMVLVLTGVFVLVMGLPIMVWRLIKRRGSRSGRVAAQDPGVQGMANYDLPLIGSRVGASVMDPESEKTVQVTGILMAYGFFNEGLGVFKYLVKCRSEDGRDLGEILDLKGPGVQDWIRSESFNSREELFKKLQLTSPKHVGLSAVGKWREKGKLTWRRENW